MLFYDALRFWREDHSQIITQQIYHPDQRIIIVLKKVLLSMRLEKQEKKLMCSKCHNPVNSAHFPIHFARCNGQSKTSRIFKKSQRQQQTEERIPCTFCSYPQTLSQLDTHPLQCPSREVECERCHESYPMYLLEQHEPMCPARERRRSRNNQQLIFNPLHRHISHEEVIRQPRPMNFFDLFRSISEGNPQRRRQRESSNEQTMPSFNHHRIVFREVDQIPFFIEVLAGRHRKNNTKNLSKKQINELPIIKFKPKKQQEPQVCTVCYCQFQEKEKVMLLPCTHMFHPDCVSKWLQKNELCPVCKQSCKKK